MLIILLSIVILNDQYTYNLQANSIHKTCTSAQDFSEGLHRATKLRDHTCVLAIRLELVCNKVLAEETFQKLIMPTQKIKSCF